MIENNPLALLPLIAAVLILATRFYVREGANSIYSASFICATIGVALLITYMTLLVLAILPPFAWIGFGGVGLTMGLVGLWSFNR